MIDLKVDVRVRVVRRGDIFEGCRGTIVSEKLDSMGRVPVLLDKASNRHWFFADELERADPSGSVDR
jgi:hypothetical protein